MKRLGVGSLHLFFLIDVVAIGIYCESKIYAETQISGKSTMNAIGSICLQLAFAIMMTGVAAAVPQSATAPVSDDSSRNQKQSAVEEANDVEAGVTPSSIKSATQHSDANETLRDDTAKTMRSDSFMNPLGPIANDQKVHLFWVTGLTMIAIIPVFVLLPLILFKYRRGRKNQKNYRPKWDSSAALELMMWGIPVVLVTFMSARLWHSTHTLDPYSKIVSPNTTVNVQVVGLDWKWLFIYPDYKIATVGEFVIPVDHPASMTLTTDTVMQSFVIPALGGQIYAMPGMTTELNLIADQLGTMEGENTQFNGDGFAEQKFMTRVVSLEAFEDWVKTVKRQGILLDEASYKILARRTRQSKSVADLGTKEMPEGVVHFTLDDGQFFDRILMRYMKHKPIKDEDQPGSPVFGVLNDVRGEASNE